MFLGGRMKKVFLVFVFAVSFVLKAATVFGDDTAPPTNPKPIKQSSKQTSDISTEVASSRSSDMKIQTEAKQSTNTVGISLTPMVGGTIYQGRWNGHIRNNYTLGVAVELSIIPHLSIEAEVGQGRYYISYSNYGHNFTQYTYGGSAKVYLTKGLVQTYLGGGVLGVTYQNMTYGIDSMTTYDRTVGAGQAIAGAEVALSNQVALGARGSYIVPMFNRPQVLSSGGYASRGYEEPAAMDTAMIRLMGTLKISL